MELDFFVMLSSLNGVVGTRGRANYAAGNTYQDALAHCRTDSQTAYISLGLGMIEDSSAYYNQAGRARRQDLIRQGFIPISRDESAAILEWILSPDAWRRGCRQLAVGIDGVSISEAENATPTTRGTVFARVQNTYTVTEPRNSTLSPAYQASITTADSLEEAWKMISDATGQKIFSLVSVGKDGI